jgi:hypothetical protein
MLNVSAIADQSLQKQFGRWEVVKSTARLGASREPADSWNFLHSRICRLKVTEHAQRDISRSR